MNLFEGSLTVGVATTNVLREADRAWRRDPGSRWGLINVILTPLSSAAGVFTSKSRISLQRSKARANR